MKFTRRTALTWLSLPLASGLSAQTADWPNKPVRLVIPYVAGGATDVLGRALAVRLSEIWKQPVVVDNRPGANEIIGATAVAKSQGDGYTLMLATDPTMSINMAMYKTMSYDPVKELVPVTRVAVANMALAVPATLPVNNLREFVEYVKKSTKPLSYGSSGVGNGTHLSMALFVKDNNLDLVHVPFKGVAPALQDVASGNTIATLAVLNAVKPLVDAGKLKLIALSGPKRAASIPNVPTFAESGFPAFECSAYFAVIAPTGTPANILQRIAADVQTIGRDQKFYKQNMEVFGMDAVLDSPSEFAVFLAEDRKRAALKVKAADAHVN